MKTLLACVLFSSLTVVACVADSGTDTGSDEDSVEKSATPRPSNGGPTTGAACHTDADCPGEHRACVSGVCVTEDPAPGGSCINDDDCPEGDTCVLDCPSHTPTSHPAKVCRPAGTGAWACPD